jgi:glycosyltransferase involved in cell wall biosynthesis
MKVTVVMCAYNRAREIGAALASALAQTHADLEVLVVDDGSSDGTPDVAAAANDARVRVIRLPQNVGASAARNVGLDAATGDAVIVWDSDDRLYPSALERLVALLAERPEAAVASAPARLLYGGVPDPEQGAGAGGAVPLEGVLCKSRVGSAEKVRLARAAAMRDVRYGERHLDFLVNVALAERGPWVRLAEFLGEVEAGDRPGSLTAGRRRRDPAAAFRRGQALAPFVERHGAAMRRSCPARLAAYEWGAAWGLLLGGDAPRARALARAALRDDPTNLRAWAVALAAHMPGLGALARAAW